MEKKLQGLKSPDVVLDELDRAAQAVRKRELRIAVHHVGNAMLLLKQALSPERPKHRAGAARHTGGRPRHAGASSA
jgi:hypothetical protein